MRNDTIYVRAHDASAEVIAFIEGRAALHGCKLYTIAARAPGPLSFRALGGDVDAWLEDCAVYIAMLKGEE